jgi:hypothetical protein
MPPGGACLVTRTPAACRRLAVASADVPELDVTSGAAAPSSRVHTRAAIGQPQFAANPGGDGLRDTLGPPTQPSSSMDREIVRPLRRMHP